MTQSTIERELRRVTQMKQLYDRATTANRKLLAERDRYKAALERIARMNAGLYPDAVNIARQALDDTGR